MFAVMKTLALAVILLWCALPTVALDPAARFTRYGMEQGLPQMYVTRITQDVQGFLWVATQDGLARFDGHTMVVHRARPADPTSIAGNHVHALVVAHDSMLYASTGGGIARYQPRTGTWTRYKNAMPAPLHTPALTEVHSAITNVTYRDKKGRLWTGTTTQGLVVTDPATATTVRFGTRSPAGRRIATNDVWALCEDRDGRMWVGTNGGGIAVIQNMQVVATFSHAPSNPTSISNDVIRYLYQDNIGTMWIGTLGGGLCQYDPYAHVLPSLQPSQVVAGVTSNAVRGIARNGKSHLLLGLPTGVLRCDTLLQLSTLVASWPQDYSTIGAARALFVDRLGTAWIGTERNGLGYMRRGAKQISWLHAGTWSTRPHTRTISYVGQIDSNHIAIGTDNGLALVDIRTHETSWIEVPRQPSLPTDRIPISAVARVADNEVLLGTEFGLYHGPLSGPYTKVVCPDWTVTRPNIDIIRSIVLHRQSAYVGTWGGGVRCINLATGTEQVIDTRHGLPNATVYAVYPVDTATMAMSSNAGIVLWDINKHRVQKCLTPRHGAQSYEFNSWSHLQLSSGTVILGGINGANTLRFYALAAPPPPTIAVAVDTSSTDHATISISAIALSGTDPVQFRYKFIGIDSIWTIASGPSLNLQHYEHGTHTMLVQARYLDGNFSESFITSFTIHPPFWSTWWFMAIMLAGGGAATWVTAAAVGRRRAAHQYEADRLIQAERIRIARDLHDEVGTGLAKIVMLAESPSAQQSPANAASIADTARDVIDRVRSIVWVMRASSEQLSHVTGYMCNRMASTLADHGITLSTSIHIKHNHMLQASQMRNIVLSMQEVTANIVRHSRASAVMMSIDTGPSNITISVQDDGVGFDTSTPDQGFGLSNLRERMHDIAGDIDIVSAPGCGTNVVLKLYITYSSHNL